MRRFLLQAVVALAAGVGSASAADVVSGDVDRDIIEAGRQIMDQAREGSLQELLGGQNPFVGRYEKAVREVVQASQEAANPFGKADPLGQDETIYVFLSYSLGDATLETILGEIAGRENVVGVMRGIPEGTKLQTGLRRLQRLAQKSSPAPIIILHPRKFQEYAVETVPTVAYRGIKGRLRVSGMVNIDWFLEQLAVAKTEDMGVRGEVREIEEPDLIEVMQSRLAKLDLEQMAKDSVETFWNRVDYHDLDETVTYRRRTIDPSIVGVRDLATMEGEVFFRAGQRLNPLEQIPFTLTLFVFDATQDDHLQLVEKWIQEQPRYSRSVLVATRLPREDGWESLKKLEERMKRPIYLLVPPVKERFQLEYAPAKVYADNDAKVFVVEEIPTTLSESRGDG